MPAPSPLWRALFGDDRPVEIEIGPGRGDVLLAFARARPDHGFVGIERCSGYADGLTERLRAAGVTNARAVGGDARLIVEHGIPPASVAAYHVYFPDPWPKRRHFERKLFQGAFAQALRRTLVPGGLLFVATDVGPLFDEMARAIDAAGFVRRRDLPPCDRPQTKFERKYGAAGTFAGVWQASG